MTKRKDKKAPVKISASEKQEKVELVSNEENLENENVIEPKEEILVEQAETNAQADEMVTQEVAQEEKSEKSTSKEDKSKSKIDKNKKEDDKKKPKKDKKERKGLKRRTKETVSELKKVTWPKFPEVVKKTGVVIAVVLIFAVILFGLDSLFGFLFNLLPKA